MRTVPVSRTREIGLPQISVLGFGCAPIGGRSSPKESLRALATAWEAGITFYDTARSYGYGQSETILGEFFRGKRDRAVICTKFGILPAKPMGWKQKMKPAARGLLKIYPGLRNRVRKQLGDQFLSNQFTVDAMRSSVEMSLRQLRTGYVDLLLLHAAPASVLEQEDLLEAMEHLVSSGKVRRVGISGDPSVMEEYFQHRPRGLDTAQFSLNLLNIGFAETTRKNGDLLLVANHPYSGGSSALELKKRLIHLRDSVDLSAEIRGKLDLSDPQVLPELTLNSILDDTGVSAVIPAMMQVRHIKSNIRALADCRFSSAELAMIRARLTRKDCQPL